jgi:hypothetical protein
MTRRFVPRGRLIYPVLGHPPGVLSNILTVMLGSTDTDHNEQHSIYRLDNESDAAFMERAQDFAHERAAEKGFSRSCRIQVRWEKWNEERMHFEDKRFNLIRAATNEKLDGAARVTAAAGILRLWDEWQLAHPEDA